MSLPADTPTYNDRPVPENVLAMAQQAVKDFHECFWWWNTKWVAKSREDVREVVLNLRKAGGHRAWRRAQELNACL
jgi:hypothetical protein